MGHHAVAIDLQAILEPGEDPVGHPHRLLLVLQVFEQDRELVAAEAGHGVPGAQARLQPARHLHQEPVPRLEADRLVDRLEAVHVEEEDGERPALALRPLRQRGMQPIEEQAPVGEAGEAVMQRRVEKLFLQPLDVVAGFG